jgi:DNA repair photolyase
MAVREIQAKSILRKHRRIDSWFISRYGMNLYRGCTHNCVYCDGRAEGYYVEGEFGRDIAVKVNALEILSRELDPGRKRVPFKPSYIMLGGGVGDSYQPVERKYQLTRGALELMHEYNFPVHMLTKSNLIERDLDMLKKINEQSRAIVSFSFSSVDDDISAVFEPGVPPPGRRLETLRLFKNEGIACGMFLLPVIPRITDTPELMEAAVRKAKEVGVDFIIFGAMTLKEGRQKDYFFNAAKKYCPWIAEEYQPIYTGSKWGEPGHKYADELHREFYRIAREYRMPIRVPPVLYRDILDENDLAVVILEQIDYLLRMKGERSSFGYAAYSISQLKEPLSGIKEGLGKLRGVKSESEAIIKEILETRSSFSHEKLLNYED